MIQLTLTTCLSIYEIQVSDFFTLICILLLAEMPSQQLNSGAGLNKMLLSKQNIIKCQDFSDLSE